MASRDVRVVSLAAAWSGLAQWAKLRGSCDAFRFDVAAYGSPRLCSLWFGLTSDGEKARRLSARECEATFDEMASVLAKVFAVSTQAMRIRLEGLRLLVRGAGVQQKDLPETGFVRLPSILAPNGPIPIGRSTWWEGLKSGRFPQAREARTSDDGLEG